MNEGNVVKNNEKTNWEPEIFISKVILLLFVILSSLQVVMRYVFNKPLSWPEELSSILLVWLVFIGATAISKRDTHVKVEIIEEKASITINKYLNIFYYTIIIIYLLFLIIGGLDLFQKLQFARTPALRLPIKWISIVVPITSAIMSIYFLRHIVKIIINKK
jgi:TRAP-type transport system small permease protein